MLDDFDYLEGTSDSTSSTASVIVAAEQFVMFWGRFCNLSLKIH